jgi:hypothetical protein
VRLLGHVLVHSFHVLARLAAAVVLLLEAARSAELGGAWYALAVLFGFLALGFLLMPGLRAWGASRYRSGFEGP